MLRLGIMPTEKVFFLVVNCFGERGLTKQLFQIFGLTTVMGLKIEKFN